MIQIEMPRAVGTLMFGEPRERERDRLFAPFGAAPRRKRRRFVLPASRQIVPHKRAHEIIHLGKRRSFERFERIGQRQRGGALFFKRGNVGFVGHIRRLDGRQFGRVNRRRIGSQLWVVDFVQYDVVAHSRF